MANQGIYHPTYNPNGSKKLSDGNFWYNTTIPIASTMDCFDSSKMLTASGNIGTTSGRPDGIFYDQVAENSILDLRNSSKKVEDYNRLISREFNKLVAGAIRGKEGEFITVFDTISVNTNSFLSTVNINSILGFTPPNNTKLTSHNISIKIIDTTDNADLTNVAYTFGNQIYVASGTSLNGHKVVISYNSRRTKSNTLLHCDIIGNPTNYPTAWKESGVFGTPLIVAEDGTSLLPNGTLDTFKLSRKANATPLLCLRSTDSGTTWTSFTPTFSTTTNAITLTDEPASNLVMVYYQTHTSMAVPTVHGEVLSFIDPTGINFNDKTQGASLVDTLIGKTPVSGSTPTLLTRRLLTMSLNPANKCFDSSYGFDAPTHSQMLFYSAYTPAVKILPYLTRINGKAYLNLVFKEMKYNGISWGDDNKFNMATNVSTTTDDNGQTVLIGQKTVELSYFIDAGE